MIAKLLLYWNGRNTLTKGDSSNLHAATGNICNSVTEYQGKQVSVDKFHEDVTSRKTRKGCDMLFSMSGKKGLEHHLKTNRAFPVIKSSSMNPTFYDFDL